MVAQEIGCSLLKVQRSMQVQTAPRAWLGPDTCAHARFQAALIKKAALPIACLCI